MHSRNSLFGLGFEAATGMGKHDYFLVAHQLGFSRVQVGVNAKPAALALGSELILQGGSKTEQGEFGKALTAPWTGAKRHASSAIEMN